MDTAAYANVSGRTHLHYAAVSGRTRFICKTVRRTLLHNVLRIVLHRGHNCMRHQTQRPPCMMLNSAAPKVQWNDLITLRHPIRQNFAEYEHFPRKDWQIKCRPTLVYFIRILVVTCIYMLCIIYLWRFCQCVYNTTRNRRALLAPKMG